MLATMHLCFCFCFCCWCKPGFWSVCIAKNASFSTDQYLEISDLIYLHQRQNFSGDLFGWVYNLFVEEHSLCCKLKLLSSCNIFIGTILQYSAAMKNNLPRFSCFLSLRIWFYLPVVPECCLIALHSFQIPNSRSILLLFTAW